MPNIRFLAWFCFPSFRRSETKADAKNLMLSKSSPGGNLTLSKFPLLAEVFACGGQEGSGNA